MRWPTKTLTKHGETYQLRKLERHFYSGRWSALYFDESGTSYILKEWQDESRTWVTIDEVYSTRFDCQTGRLEAA